MAGITSIYSSVEFDLWLSGAADPNFMIFVAPRGCGARFTGQSLSPVIFNSIYTRLSTAMTQKGTLENTPVLMIGNGKTPLVHRLTEPSRCIRFRADNSTARWD